METFVGDTVRIVLNTAMDISGYGTLKIRYRKPNGFTGSWTATVYPGTTESMMYECLETDLDIPGIWAVQAYIAATGFRLHGLWAEFTVYKSVLTDYTMLAGAGAFA